MATKTEMDLRPILASIAKASHFTREAWLELEQALPRVRELCPDFYENMTHLMLAAFEYHQTMEGAADDLVRIKGLPAPHRPPLLTGKA